MVAENEQKEVVEVKNGPKEIVVVNATAPNSNVDGFTNILIRKMHAYAKKHQMDVHIQMYSASKIDDIGKETDIILLAPGIYVMEAEVRSKFPKQVVKLIEQKDYGFLDVEHILTAVLSTSSKRLPPQRR